MLDRKEKIMLSLTHTFKCWHPREGLPSVYAEHKFTFNSPVSKAQARYQIEKVEGYVIEKVKRGAK